MIRRLPDNAEIADLLERVADLLEAKGTDAWRLRAWRGGAATARASDRPLALILQEEGRAGLVKLPRIGKSLSAAIGEYVETGRLALLEDLETELSPAGLFRSLPGIGTELADRIHRHLGIQTLEDLEVAAHDGRLAAVPGFGPRRVRSLRDELAVLMRQSVRRRVRQAAHRGSDGEDEQAGATSGEPPVSLLLDVDQAYRDAAEAGTLERIAPRRFNPEHRPWLPIQRVERDGWRFRVLFSNSARAHELGTTHDWVLVTWERDGRQGMVTVVTEHRGPLAGRRVVRGREAECLEHYATSSDGSWHLIG